MAMLQKYAKIRDIKTDDSYPCMDAFILLPDIDGEQRVAFGSSGSSDRHKIIIYNISSGILERKLIGHERVVSCLALLSNGILVSGSFDNTIIIWDAENEREIRRLRGHTCSIRSLAITSDGFIISGSEDYFVMGV